MSQTSPGAVHSRDQVSPCIETGEFCFNNIEMEFLIKTEWFQGKRILVTDWIEPPKCSYYEDSWAQYVCLIPCSTGKEDDLGLLPCVGQADRREGAWRKLWNSQLDSKHSLQALATLYNTLDESLVKRVDKTSDGNQTVDLERAKPLRRLGD